jgi:hypothetical protein
MIPKQDNWGIVLAGHWNRMIFTPEWVGARLFHQEDVEAQVALMPVFPIIYRHGDVSIEVSSSRLIFRPRFDSTQSLEAAERMAVTVLDDLPNTPLAGVGINFSFVEREPPPKLISLFNLEDGRFIERAEWEAPETKISRKLNGPLGTMLLTLTQDADGVTLDFNFHTDTSGVPTTAANAKARAALADRLVKLRETAVAFARDIYKLKMEEG